MIAKTLLRKLKPNKKYLIYDELYEYVLTKYKDSQYHINVYGSTEKMFLIEKDLEDLKLNSYGDDEMLDFYKYDYQYNGYTNKYKALCSVGYLSLHSDFTDFYRLKFFGEIKNETNIKNLRQFIKFTGQRSKLKEKLREFKRKGKDE